MRLTARSDLTEPSDSTTRAEGTPRRPPRKSSMATRSPSSASPAMPCGHQIVAAGGPLLDRQCAAAAAVRVAIDGEYARLHPVENLDHTTGIGWLLRPGVGIEFDPHQHPRPHARRRPALAPAARPAHQDARRLPVFAPFGGLCDQLAVAVALGDVGDDDRRQPPRSVQRLAAARDERRRSAGP